VGTPRRLLTIAGSDSGGGAGIQADLKTFAAHGAYGMSVVTAVTAQNTVAVTAVAPVPPAVVAAQIDAVLLDLGADGIKVGMLGDEATVRVVAERLQAHGAGRAGFPPLVLDPVMISKSGTRLLAPEAVAALVEELLPLATVVTPNGPELMTLAEHPVTTEAERGDAALRLVRRSGGVAVLAKGGHAEGNPVVDLLVSPRGRLRFAHPRLDTRSTHGTGCTLSSAVAVYLAAGLPVEQAVPRAIGYVTGALVHAVPLGHGHGPLNHLWSHPRP
jgi:hydroxymethylpyrimidine/phosphomethylpyrimidine kinase